MKTLSSISQTGLVLVLLLWKTQIVFAQPFELLRKTYVVENELAHLGFFQYDLGGDGIYEFITDANNEGNVIIGRLINSRYEILRLAPSSQYVNDLKGLRFEDTDQDGKNELYILRDSEGLIRLDTSTLSPIATYPDFDIQPGFNSNYIIMTDADLDGDREWLRIHSSDGLTAFELAGFTVTYNMPAIRGTKIEAGNLDLEPGIELVVLSSSGIKILDGATLTEEHQLSGSSYKDIDITDLDGDGKEELVLRRSTLVEIYDHVTKSVVDDYNAGSSYDYHFFRNIDADPAQEIVLYNENFTAFHYINTEPLAFIDQYTLPDNAELGIYAGADKNGDSYQSLFIPPSGINTYSFLTRRYFPSVKQGPPSGVLLLPTEYKPNRMLTHPAGSQDLFVKSLVDFQTTSQFTAEDFFDGHIADFGSRLSHYEERGLPSGRIMVNNNYDFTITNLQTGFHQEYFTMNGGYQIMDDLDYNGTTELINRNPDGIHVYESIGLGRFNPTFSIVPPVYQPELRIGQLDETIAKEILAYNFQGIWVYNGATGALIREISEVSAGGILDVLTYRAANNDFHIVFIYSETAVIYNYTQYDIVDNIDIRGTQQAHGRILQVKENDVLRTYIIIHGERVQIFNEAGFVVYEEPTEKGSNGATRVLITDYDNDEKPNLIASSSNRYTEFEYIGPGTPVESFYPVMVSPSDSIRLNASTSFLLQFSEPVLQSSILSNISISSVLQGNLTYTIEDLGRHMIRLTHEPLINPNDTVTLTIHGTLRSESLKYFDSNHDNISLGATEPIHSVTYILDADHPQVKPSITLASNPPQDFFKDSRRTISISVFSGSDLVPLTSITYGIEGHSSNGQLSNDKSIDEPSEDFEIPVNTFGLADGNYNLIIYATNLLGSVDTFLLNFNVIAEQGYYDKNKGADDYRSSYYANPLGSANLKKLTIINHTNSERITHLVGGDRHFYYMMHNPFVDTLVVRKINLLTFETAWAKGFNPHSVRESLHLDKGLLYMVSKDTNTAKSCVYALDIFSGDITWQQEFYAYTAFASSPLTDNEHVLISGGRYGGTFAFDRWTGEYKWYTERVDIETDQGSAAIYKGKAYLAEQRVLKSINMNTGQLNWRVEIDDELPFLYERNAIIDTLHQQFFWIGDEKLHSRNLMTGGENFSVDAKNNTQNPVLFKEEIVLFQYSDVRVYSAVNGTLLRQKEFNKVIVAQPIAFQGKLLVPLADRFVVLDLKTLATVYSEPLILKDISVIDQFLLLTTTGDDIHIYEMLPTTVSPSVRWTEATFIGSHVVTMLHTFNDFPIEQHGKLYYEILRSESESGGNWSPTGIYMRYDAPEIYYANNTEEFPVIDFSLSLNDEYILPFGPTYTVVAIDTILLENGESRRRLTMNCEEEGSTPLYWIDGMGSVAGMANIFTTCATDISHQVLCYWQGDSLVYDNPAYDGCWLLGVATHDLADNGISVYPNPFTNEFHIDAEEGSIKRAELFDAVGKMQFTGQSDDINGDALNPGLYFLRLLMVNGTNLYYPVVKM